MYPSIVFFTSCTMRHILEYPNARNSVAYENGWTFEKFKPSMFLAKVSMSHNKRVSSYEKIDLYMLNTFKRAKSNVAGLWSKIP